MKKVLLILALVLVGANLQAAEVQMDESSTAETVEYWILDSVS